MSRGATFVCVSRGLSKKPPKVVLTFNPEVMEGEG